MRNTFFKVLEEVFGAFADDDIKYLEILEFINGDPKTDINPLNVDDTDF